MAVDEEDKDGAVVEDTGEEDEEKRARKGYLVQ